jgi:hypothetical protein
MYDLIKVYKDDLLSNFYDAYPIINERYLYLMNKPVENL